VLAVEDQDGIGADGPERGGHPDDQAPEIVVGDVDVVSEQLDRAVAAGHGERQVPVAAPKVDGRVVDNRPALGADPDGPAG